MEQPRFSYGEQSRIFTFPEKAPLVARRSIVGKYKEFRLFIPDIQNKDNRISGRPTLQYF